MAKSASDILELLRRYRFNFTSELEMQSGIEQVLKSNKLDYQREYVLTSEDRLDFMVEGVAIECKVAGSKGDLCRQIERYARHDDVNSVLVVTNRIRHSDVPGWLHGKEVMVFSVVLGGL